MVDKATIRQIIERNQKMYGGKPYGMDEIHAMADRIKAGLPDACVYLVGPYAWGWGERSHSVGFAIALPDEVLERTPTWKLEGEARRLAEPGEIPVEITVYPASIVADAPADILGMRNIEM